MRVAAERIFVTGLDGAVGFYAAVVGTATIVGCRRRVRSV